MSLTQECDYDTVGEMKTKGYTKLFAEIVTSSIWSENDPTRIVWITILALCDAEGMVRAALPGLARIANVAFEDCCEAIKKLESPDSFSRSEEFEGRRIEKVDGGWHVLNFEKYRDMMNKEARLQYLNRKHKEYRSKALDARREANKGKTVREIANEMSGGTSTLGGAGE